MKKILVLIFFVFLIIGCDQSNTNNNNPYLPNTSFSVQINISLPTYSNLQFPSNALKVDFANAGIRGIIVFNTGTGYRAFDGACPNQNVSTCSTLTLSGINATCPCDSAVYSLFTAQSPGKQYPLKEYRAEISGTIITISN